MSTRENITQALSSALPVILGYVAIGIPCGILSVSIGLNLLQIAMLSVFFYSGAGQFMIPNMWLAGSPIASIVASVSLVNTRQMLYSASLAPFAQGVGKGLAFLFSATVTDESYGVNVSKFCERDWSIAKATLVNLFSQSSWVLSNILGALLAGVLSIPLAFASFAMTSIFICLLATQKLSSANMLAVATSMLGVFVCKLVGLNGSAILVGAFAGVVAAFIFTELKKR